MATLQSEMAKVTIRRSIKLASMLDTRINADKFLSGLSDNPEKNYVIFTGFTCECSDSLLGVLYQLGYFNSDNRILRIAAEIVEMRRMFGHVEEDVEGYIANLLSHNFQGKHLFFSLIFKK